MGKLVLVTGGARSGKSTFAEETAAKTGDNVLYVATAIPVDDEMKLRIHKHREQRPSGWETVEAYKDFDQKLKNRIQGKSAVLLDCLTIMITNIIFEMCRDIDNISSEEAVEMERAIGIELEKLLDMVMPADTTLIIVTNEVGMGVVPEYSSGRLFRDIAGRANQMLVKAAHEVYLCISGIPVKIK